MHAKATQVKIALGFSEVALQLLFMELNNVGTYRVGSFSDITCLLRLTVVFFCINKLVK